MIQQYVTWVLCGSILAVAVVYFTQLIQKIIAQKKLFDKIPGPPGIPLLGNVYEMVTNLQPEKLWHFTRSMSNKYYPIFKAYGVNVPFTCIIGPEDIESVISTMKNTKKGDLLKCLHPWLGKGLLTNYGSNWQMRRKILNNAFHFNIIQQFLEVFAEQSQLLVTKLEQECRKPSTSIVPYIAEFTLHSICETAMGTSHDTSEENQEEYRNAIHEIGKLVVYRTLRPWLLIGAVFPLTPTYRKQKKLVEILHQFSTKVIRNRTVDFKDVDNILNKPSDDGISKKRLAMLDLLLTAQNSSNSVTDVEIREEVDTFIFEGHDTTTIAISFALLQLANNQDIQDQIVEELNQVLGESDEHPTYQHLQNMQYLERVIKETLRMYPSVPVITRVISEDTVTHSGYTIPAQTNVFIMIYDLHHCPEIYPDPFKFDPDRFLPEECRKRHPFAYLPFSAGPRNCIGQKFAMMELKSVISSILRKFVLKSVDKPSDMRFTSDIVLRIENDIRIKLELR